MEAVLFDLDGTLWDTTAKTGPLWNSVFARYPEITVRLSQKEMRKFAGKTMEEIGALLFPSMSRTFQEKILEECGKAEVVFLLEHGGVLFPGVRETLHRLAADHDLYIVSNCQRGYIEAFLTAHGFTGLFREFEMSGRTGLSKGENIRLVMERNHIREGIYVGDTESDEKAASFAGIPFIHASYGFGKAISPDAVIRKISELPEVLPGFRNRRLNRYV